MKFPGRAGSGVCGKGIPPSMRLVLVGSLSSVTEGVGVGGLRKVEKGSGRGRGGDRVG